MFSSNKTKELSVLCPNGRRVNIKTNPSTSIGQIIEEACLKQGFDPYDYNLKFLQRILDPSSTLHYSNIPNRAQLEVVKAAERRKEGCVTVNLVTEKGQRLIADFPSSASLWDVLMHHEGEPGSNFHVARPSDNCEPCVVYTMRKITGQELKTCTLKSLGLFSGKCMMRYNIQKIEAEESSVVIVSPKTFMKASRLTSESSTSNVSPQGGDSVHQAHNSSECRGMSSAVEPKGETTSDETSRMSSAVEPKGETTSDETSRKSSAVEEKMECEDVSSLTQSSNTTIPVERLAANNVEAVCSEVKESSPSSKPSPEPSEPSRSTQRNVMAEKAIPYVVPLSDHSSVLFSLDDAPETTPAEEHDDFFQLTVSEVRSLYRERVQQLSEMENTPMMTSAMRQLEKDSRLLTALNRHPVTQLRICFPDRLVIQANFKPHDTIRDVMDFLAPLLVRTHLKFHLYTIFPRQVLDPGLSLVEAGCIPKAKLYFGCTEETANFLSPETLAKKSSFEAATNALIKSTRGAPSCEELETTVASASEVTANQTSHCINRSSGAISKKTTENNGAPKWFKLGK